MTLTPILLSGDPCCVEVQITMRGIQSGIKVKKVIESESFVKVAMFTFSLFTIVNLYSKDM